MKRKERLDLVQAAVEGTQEDQLSSSSCASYTIGLRSARTARASCCTEEDTGRKWGRRRFEKPWRLRWSWRADGKGSEARRYSIRCVDQARSRSRPRLSRVELRPGCNGTFNS